MTREQLKDGGWVESSPGQFVKGNKPYGFNEVKFPDPPQPKKRLRQSQKPKPMNQIESRFYEILKERFPGATITPQFRLRISPWGAPVNVFYTADFLLSDKVAPLLGPSNCYAWRHSAYEVKDKRRKPHSDELTRAKMCKEHNPWISVVHLAEWDGENWNERVIA